MKIPLNMGEDGQSASDAARAKVLEHDILAAKKGDYAAKTSLIRTFSPLIASLAQKRSEDTAKVNQYIEAGKNGLVKAARRYRPSIGADRFQIFALDYIEAAMDRVAGGGGFFSRLFK